MSRRRSVWSVTAAVGDAVIAFLAADFFPAVARADLEATLEVPSQAGSDLDLASFDIATRARLGNPFHPGGFVGPGVETSAGAVVHAQAHATFKHVADVLDLA